MEGPLFRVPCSSFPKDYRGHIDSEIMGYLFTNNNNSDQGPVQTKLWPTNQEAFHVVVVGWNGIRNGMVGPKK